MDPSSMAGAGIAGTIAGGVVKTMGEAYSGQASSNMYRYQSAVAQINKQIDLQNADYAVHTGEVKAQESALQTRQRIGTTIAQQGAGNLDVRSGSNVAVQDSELKLGQFDEALIRSDAAKRAYGYKVEAAGEEAKSQMSLSAARTSKTAAQFAELGSIIGTATSVDDKWMQYKASFGT